MLDSTTVSFCTFFVAGSIAALTVYLTSDLTPLGRQFYGLLASVDDSPASGGIHPYQVALGLCLLLLFVGYIADVHLWFDRQLSRLVANAYVLLVAACFVAGQLLYAPEAPSIPPLVGVSLGAWAVYLVRLNGFGRATAEEFSLAASHAYVAIGGFCAAVWAAWAFTPWMGVHTWDWNDSAKPSVHTQSFVRWCSPFLVALLHALIGLFLRLRSRMHRIDNFVIAELKLVGMTLVLLALFTWLAASVAAGDAGLSKMILRISVVVGVAAVCYMVWSLGPASIIDSCSSAEAVNLLMPVISSDWAKAAFVIIFLPLFPVFVVIEVFHMSVRCRIQGVLTQWERSRHHWITDEGAVAIDNIGSWHAAGVLTKSIWLGILYFLVQVGCGRGVVVFLAWVGEWSVNYSLPAILGILFGIGLMLFMLPPVPGCPIYIIAAILVTKRFEDGGTHFIFGCLLATALCMAIKLAAVAMQQKLIGEPFSTSIAVKKFIAIYTPEMKAIRHILSKPGLRFDKVVVLCCGPDWPTSVLTGILNLPVLQMLLGTLPVVVVLLPFTLSASFMVHASRLQEQSLRQRRYEGLANAMLLLSMMLQMGGMLLIAHFTSLKREEFRAELAAGAWMRDPQEREVLERVGLDEARRQATRWRALPQVLRLVLALGALAASLVVHIILLPFVKPFKDFSLEDKLSEVQGVHFLINAPGWVAIALLCFSVTCLAIFELWYAFGATSPNEKQTLQAGAKASGGQYDGA